MTDRFGGSTEPSALAVRGQSGRAATSPVDRARRAATELRGALEAAATADEREQVAAIVAGLTGTGASIAELADQALETTRPIFGSPPVAETSSVATSGGGPPLE